MLFVFQTVPFLFGVAVGEKYPWPWRDYVVSKVSSYFEEDSKLIVFCQDLLVFVFRYTI